MSKEYSEADKAEFRAKDLRIARESILKPLIEKLELEVVYDVNKVTTLCEQYINYVYNGVSTGNVASSPESIDWVNIAEGLNLTIPTDQNIEALNILMQNDKVKQAGFLPSDTLASIINGFGKYPTNQKGVDKVVKLLTT